MSGGKLEIHVSVRTSVLVTGSVFHFRRRLGLVEYFLNSFFRFVVSLFEENSTSLETFIYWIWPSLEFLRISIARVYEFFAPRRLSVIGRFEKRICARSERSLLSIVRISHFDILKNLFQLFWRIKLWLSSQNSQKNLTDWLLTTDQLAHAWTRRNTFNTF